MNQRVVITGIGAVTPLGNDLETTWSNLVNGKSGIAHEPTRVTVSDDKSVALLSLPTIGNGTDSESQRAVTALMQCGDQGESLHLVRGDLVLAQKTGQLAIRVKDVAVLVCTIQRAVVQAFEQIETLLTAEHPG